MIFLKLKFLKKNCSESFVSYDIRSPVLILAVIDDISSAGLCVLFLLMIYIYIPLLSSAVLYLAEDENLPRWFCDLMTCNIAVENFDIQTTTIGIVMELIQLTRSVGSDDPDHSTVDHSPTGGTVSVMILPALLPRHLKYLNENTVFYKVRL